MLACFLDLSVLLENSTAGAEPVQEEVAYEAAVVIEMRTDLPTIDCGANAAESPQEARNAHAVASRIADSSGLQIAQTTRHTRSNEAAACVVAAATQRLIEVLSRHYKPLLGNAQTNALWTVI